MNEAIKFARNYGNINDDMTNTIMNSWKAFSFYDGDPWVNKDTLQHFHVTEGSFYWAEVCELVDLYLLNQLRDIIKNRSIGVYRDDSLVSCAQIFWPSNGEIKIKNDIEFFKQHGFQIMIEINLKITDFFRYLFRSWKWCVLPKQKT